MATPEPNARPPENKRPSLLAGADSSATTAKSSGSVRMLDAVERNPAAQVAASRTTAPTITHRLSWGLMAALLCLAVAVTLFVLLRPQLSAPPAEPGSSVTVTSPQSIAPASAEVATAALTVPAATPVSATAPPGIEPAAPVIVAVTPPATAQLSSAPAAAALAADSLLGGADNPATVVAKPSPKTTPTPERATVAAKTAEATKQQQRAAAKKQSVLDPDAEIVAAIMANIDRKPPKARSDTSVNELAQRCLDKADAIDGLLCRQRICADHWGKVKSCPKDLSPKSHTAQQAH